MFGSLTDLFGKNFVVGFALPAFLAVLALALITDSAGVTKITPPITSYLTDGTDEPDADSKKVTLDVKSAPVIVYLKQGEADRKTAVPAAKPEPDKPHVSFPAGRMAFLAAVAFVLAVLFLATNVIITRLLEGYGTFNPLRLLHPIQIAKFRDLEKKIADNDEQRGAEWINAVRILASNFPEAERLVLPTTFGNIMRAFERYPQVIYGIEPIETWARLEPIMSDAHRKILEDTKAQLDFWINVWVSASVAGLVSLILAVVVENLQLRLQPGFDLTGVHIPYAVVLAIMAGGVARAGACSLAIQYGSYVKSVFELQRKDLATKLGLALPQSLSEERKMWLFLAWTMVNRDAESAEGIAAYYDKPAKPLDLS